MERLFIYGSLQPGGPNEHVLTAIGGEWASAIVKGSLVEGGWGASMGFPGLLIDDDGSDVHGHVFSSPNLTQNWDYLDEFEGEEYERVVTSATLNSGEQVEAYVYVLQSG